MTGKICLTGNQNRLADIDAIVADAQYVEPVCEI